MNRYQSFSFIYINIEYLNTVYNTQFTSTSLHTIMNVPAKLDNHNVHDDTVLG